MKKLLLLLVGVVIGYAICYFMSGTEYATKDGSETKEVAVTKPKGVITQSQGETLDRAFSSRHALISDSIVKRPDNRSSWYSLKDMKNYLSYAEAETRTLGYKMNGVRIYLGAHANTQAGIGYTTMFLVPTGSQGVSEGSMFYMALQGGGDIPGGPVLNAGGEGDPPNGNYPNN